MGSSQFFIARSIRPPQAAEYTVSSYVCPHNVFLKQQMLIDNRFELLSTLARGASGTVFLARDIAIDREVVLKEFDTEHSGRSGARIEREAKLYGRIEHPSIVRLHDVFVYQGKHFLVLSYIKGKTLASLMTSQRVRLQAAVKYTHGILEGVGHLHENNIIHRDIKPTNIMIEERTERPVIIDLGIGKFTDDVSELTDRHVLVGTPAYMSIEAIEDYPLTPAADVYSTGVVLFEMIAGRLPYIAESASQLFFKVLNDHVPSVAEFRPAVPPDLASLVSRMLAKNPQHRPTVTQAVSVLNGLLAIDWDKVDQQDVHSAATVVSDGAQLSAQVRVTQVQDNESVRVTGFFSSEVSRFEEFKRSINFYRSHLDSEYKQLILQANVAFWLWLACSGATFLILAVGVILLYRNAVVPGTVTLASQVLILLLQRVFKNREDHYRNQAAIKNEHLELGNLWNLAVQSLDGLGVTPLREQKLAEVVDALTDRLKTKGLPSPPSITR